MPLPQPIQDVLAQCGITEETAHKFRFGGVVGKIAIVSLAGLVSTIGIVKYAAVGYVQLVLALASLGVTVLIVYWILCYAEKHPVSATLEGTEIILWRQQQMMLAAKGIDAPKDSPIISDPQGTQPQISPPQGADQ